MEFVQSVKREHHTRAATLAGGFGGTMLGAHVPMIMAPFGLPVATGALVLGGVGAVMAHSLRHTLTKGDVASVIDWATRAGLATAEFNLEMTRIQSKLTLGLAAYGTAALAAYSGNKASYADLIRIANDAPEAIENGALAAIATGKGKSKKTIGDIQGKMAAARAARVIELGGGEDAVSQVLAEHVAIQGGALALEDDKTTPALKRMKELFDESVSEGKPLTIDAKDIPALRDSAGSSSSSDGNRVLGASPGAAAAALPGSSMTPEQIRALVREEAAKTSSNTRAYLEAKAQAKPKSRWRTRLQETG